MPSWSRPLRSVNSWSVTCCSIGSRSIGSWWNVVILALIAALALGCEIPGAGSGDDDSSSSKKKKSGKKKKKKKSGKKKKKKKSGKKKKKKKSGDDGDAPKDAACKKVLATYTCIRDNAPPSARGALDEQIKNTKKTLEKLGPNAATACDGMLKSLEAMAKQYDCDTGGADRPQPRPGSPVPQPPSAPATRPPSTSEWSRVTQEVIVKGGSLLNCTSKRKNEWLRVSCRGRNHTGGTPKSIKVTKGSGKWGDRVDSGPAVTSLVVRFVPGIDLEAELVWTDRTHTLHVSWPSGAAEPKTKGRFEPLPTK